MGFREFRIGAIVGLPVIVAALAYVLLTPAGPRRPEILVLIAVAAVTLLAVLSPPARSWILRHDPDAAMTLWCASFIALAATACILDRGLSSPFVAVFFISLTYGAVALPASRVVALAALDLVGLAVVAVSHGLSSPAMIGVLILWASILVAMAAIATLVADDRSRRAGALRRSQHEIVHRLARVVESRDTDTGGHVDRMSRYAELVASELGWSAEACRELRLAAALHDVGKVAVPDSILLKPDSLTPAERAIMQQHCAAGHEMLSGSESRLLDLAAVIALTHHERWDGDGYPRRLSGPGIPLCGRIVAVADVFDALTSQRVYKAAIDHDEALAIIEQGRGTQFDPAIVDAFVARFGEISARCRDSRDSRAAEADPAQAEAAPSVAMVAA